MATVVFLKASIEEWEEGPLQLAMRRIEGGSHTTYGLALRRFPDSSERGWRQQSMADCNSWLDDHVGTPRREGCYQPSECLRNLDSSHKPTPVGIGCKLKESGEFPPQTPPPECLHKQPTLSTSERPVTIKSWSVCFSSPCARWSTACDQGMPNVLPGMCGGWGMAQIL